ncbi:hypothetical protein Pst134EB_001387 [Puccinia striiformis f. sp. tritici]|nr:hypothetical protein Pst134EB_001387 [Puccinia striiformis f. sp. tritici]
MINSVSRPTKPSSSYRCEIIAITKGVATRLHPVKSAASTGLAEAEGTLHLRRVYSLHPPNDPFSPLGPGHASFHHHPTIRSAHSENVFR